MNGCKHYNKEIMIHLFYCSFCSNLFISSLKKKTKKPAKNDSQYCICIFPTMSIPFKKNNRYKYFFKIHYDRTATDGTNGNGGQKGLHVFPCLIMKNNYSTYQKLPLFIHLYLLICLFET